ncbi:MAG: UDP-N-acetylglucosamine 2-epimerase (non-hydrolyzing) [Nitrososphaeria archaeon]
MKNVLVIFGTRPEAIKLAPLIFEFKKSNRFNCFVCSTGQHKEMLSQVVDFFNIPIDYNLDVMTQNQTLSSLTAKLMVELDKVIMSQGFDYIVVQGDTTTAFVGAMVGFFNKIKVVHVEAGLRTNNKYSPFPEEINRVLISKVADFHFCPTHKAVLNLQNENVNENVFNVGNTVIDSLLMAKSILESNNQTKYLKLFNKVDFSKKIILVTFHRRENHGQNLLNLIQALKKIAHRDDIQIVFPVHLNPNIKDKVYSSLVGIDNIFLFSPFSYDEMVWIMTKSYLILTDSGGIQEEAPTFGIPVLIIRDTTERQEAIESGCALLVGNKEEDIVKYCIDLLDNKNDMYRKMASSKNPFGDGTASQKIVNILEGILE